MGYPVRESGRNEKVCERERMRLQKMRERKIMNIFFAISDSFPNCFLVCFIFMSFSKHWSRQPSTKNIMQIKFYDKRIKLCRKKHNFVARRRTLISKILSDQNFLSNNKEPRSSGKSICVQSERTWVQTQFFPKVFPFSHIR